MRKKTIGLFFILGIVMFLVGIGVFVMGVMGSTSVYNPHTGANQLTSIGHLPLFIAGILLYVLALVLFLVAWVGALINLARLQQWLWFVLMFLFNGVCLIVYLFAGPEAPRDTHNQQPVWQSGQRPQPPQNYPF